MAWPFGKKPKPARIRKYSGNQAGGAHGGIAAGSSKNPNLSPENIAKWSTLTGDQIEDFLYNGALLPVHSTNVVAAQYHIESEKLMVEYGDGSYLYSNVSEDEAMSFLKAPSKGSWCWSTLRVRGSKTAHKKPYVKL